MEIIMAPWSSEAGKQALFRNFRRLNPGSVRVRDGISPSDRGPLAVTAEGIRYRGDRTLQARTEHPHAGAATKTNTSTKNPTSGIFRTGLPDHWIRTPDRILLRSDPMMKPLASGLHRLDRFLSDLNPDSEAMLLSELDGFIAGLVVCPDIIMPSEWLDMVWGDEGACFESEQQAQEIVGLIMRHFNQVGRKLGRPGKYEPIFARDSDGSVLWELWASGFRKAFELRPTAWSAFAGADDDVNRALFSLIRVGEIADGEGDDASDLDRFLREHAPDLIAPSLETLHQARLLMQAPAPGQSGPATKPVGRNDPCPCGSGKKFKKCCLH